MVNVLIVTYGDRWQLLKEVINSLIHLEGINKIVLVDNNSNYDLKQKIQLLSKKVVLIHSQINLGSSGGFKLGLNYLTQNFKEGYIWLLDDDNLPAPNTLNILLKGFENKRREKGNHMFALMCLRPDRPYLVKIAKGEPVKRVLPTENSFFGFHLFNLVSKIAGKFIANKKQLKYDFINLPFAPYGGLFFPIEILNQIGLPDERYYLYADDFEFTHRITASGGDIYLMPDAIVTDLEKSWVNNKNNLIRSRLLEQNNFKSYLSARNTIHFQKHFLTNNKLLYGMNKLIYLSYLFTIAIASGRLHQFRLLVVAINEGEKGVFENEKYLNSI